MTKTELVASISAKIQYLSPQDTRHAVDVILNGIINAACEGDRVEIRGFGTFKSVIRPAKLGRNPKTGKAVQIPSKRIIRFTVSRELIDRINHR